jgi:hypothetical protein
MRSSEKSNYSIWEPLYYYNATEEESKKATAPNKSLIFSDYTIESGISY